MSTVACVLRSGGHYSRRWVLALKIGLNQYLPEFRFVCLTDMPGIPPVWDFPLHHGWPGWWSKMELFRPGLFEPGESVLYMDLDTLPVGDLGSLTSYDGELAMLSDFYRPDRAQSGVMAFRAGAETARLWDLWQQNPKRWMGTHRGDGEWLHAHARADRLQPRYPGQLVSLKVHAQSGVPEGARLVCGHGRPRFDQPSAGWAHREWTKRANPFATVP